MYINKKKTITKIEKKIQNTLSKNVFSLNFFLKKAHTSVLGLHVPSKRILTHCLALAKSAWAFEIRYTFLTIWMQF